MDLPSTRPAATAIPDQPGEHIVAVAAARQKPADPLLVAGRFRISQARAKELGTEPHRALVVAVALANAAEFAAALPFAKASLFPDDTTAAGGMVTGHFQVDARELSGIRYPGDFTVICSLGALTAKPVRITAR